MSAHKIVSWRVYLAVFAALAVLTAITVQVAGHDFGRLNLFVALAIAVTKATLVVLYFMHARYSSKLTALVIASGVAFLAILILLTLSDYVSRPWPIAMAG
jgi:cytochrome c oxidase subunit 4